MMSCFDRSNLQNWRFYGDKQRDLRMWLVVLLVVWGSPLAWSSLVWYMEEFEFIVGRDM